MKELIIRMDDEKAISAALIIDDSHSRLFNMFFGWRGTYTNGKYQYARFLFTNRDYYTWFMMINDED